MKWFLGIYALIAMANVYASHMQWEGYDRLWIKALIMVSMISYYTYRLRGQVLNPKERLVFLIALVFALAGDALLVFSQYLIPGVGIFIMMQSIYTLLFWRDKKDWNSNNLIYAVFLGFFILTILIAIWPSIQTGTLIPVVVYTVLVSSMSFVAFGRDSSLPGFNSVWIGSTFFVFSNIIFGIEGFVLSFRYSWELIILTYIIAQYLIIDGMVEYFLKGRDRTESRGELTTY